MKKNQLHRAARRLFRKGSVIAASVTAACSVLLLLSTVPAFSQKVRVLRATVPVAARTKLVNHLTNTDMDLVIGLPYRNQTALTRQLKEIYNPLSPMYRHYLTPAQFNATYAPKVADYQTLLNFAKDNNLTVVMTHANHRLLHVRAPVSVVEQAFRVKINTYAHPKEKRTFYAPAGNPSLKLKLPEIYVTGLDNFVIPHPAVEMKPTDKKDHLESGPGSGVGGAFNAKDFRPAYVPGTALNGTGQTVGLLQFDGYFPSDIQAYEAEAGLLNVPIQNVFLDGFQGIPGVNNGETSLDMEMVIAMAPNISKLVIYGVPSDASTDDVLNEMANPTQGEPLPNQISTSWGFFYDQNVYNAFQQMAMQGQTFFAASNDFGAYADNAQAAGPLPQPPADYSYVTSVGGTSLSTTAPGGGWQSETTWPSSGGGPSPWFAIPDWQSGMDMSANHGSSTMRNCPDVAMAADNIEIISGNGKKSSIGGTSASSPLWAGFMALVNQQAAASAKPPAGYINPILYAIGKGPNYRTCFHDIQSGSNTNTGNTNKYAAVAGYDLCTGWGTPAGVNLINALALSNYEVTYNIVQPIVNRSGPIVYDGVSASPAIHFEPGDLVTVKAGGCVQTGGTGLTWKRYVIPSGPESDKFYFCTIQIPGLTQGLVPLRGTGGGIDASHLDIYTVDFTQPVPDILSGQQQYLVLGYTDDHYDDNGYWGHDDGTENQCKGVGDAFMKVTIIRKITPQ